MYSKEEAEFIYNELKKPWKKPNNNWIICSQKLADEISNALPDEIK